MPTLAAASSSESPALSRAHFRIEGLTVGIRRYSHKRDILGERIFLSDTKTSAGIRVSEQQSCSLSVAGMEPSFPILPSAYGKPPVRYRDRASTLLMTVCGWKTERVLLKNPRAKRTPFLGGEDSG
jgi:hypothetical protein